MPSFKNLISTLLFIGSAFALPMANGTESLASSDCPHGAQIFVARATGELTSTGISFVVANDIMSGVPNSVLQGIPYPATANAYPISEGLGVQSLKDIVNDFVSACPNTHYYLIGYSQGAQVVMDTLCGTSEIGFAPTNALSSSTTSKMLGAIVFGDPSHVVGQSYEIGTSKNNGMFPRTDLGACNPYDSRLRSYCDAGDPFCAGGLDELVHLNYIAEYGASAAQWAIAKYHN